MSEDDIYNFDPEGFISSDDDAGYESEQNPEVAKLKELGLSSQLKEVDESYYNNLGNKKLALRQSPSPIVFEQVAKSEPKPKPPAKVVKAARPMVKAKPPQRPVSDEKAEAEADKFWMRMGHDPFRIRAPGGQFVYKLPDGSWAPIPWDRIPPRPIPVRSRPKGGTRKRSTHRRGGAYKKRTTRKRMRKHATRRRR